MKLLVAGTFGNDPGHLKALRRAGHEVLCLSDEQGDLPEGVGVIEGVICNALFLHHDLGRFPNLKLVHLTSAGTDRVPVAALEQRGIRLFNARGVYSVPVAEWVVLQILQLAKRARFFLRNQEVRHWQKAYNLAELSGRTACVIGFGEVGREVAKRLLAFDLNVVAVTAHPAPSSLAHSVVGIGRLAEVLPAADIIVIALPLSDDTFHLLDGRTIRLMKSDSILVNVARGGVIDERALISALEDGRFSGVALDVFEEEPLVDANPLWGFDRVLVTPHNSFASDQNGRRLLACVLRNLTSTDDATNNEAHRRAEMEGATFQ